MGEAWNSRSARISSRQVDELVDLARSFAADGTVTQAEAEFLQNWMGEHVELSDQTVIRALYRLVNDVLSDGLLDPDEGRELLHMLRSFSCCDPALGEVLKSIASRRSGVRPGTI